MPSEYLEMRDLGDEQPERSIVQKEIARYVESYSPFFGCNISEQLPTESAEAYRERIGIQ